MTIKYTKEQLDCVDKALLIELFLKQQDLLEQQLKKTDELNEKIQKILEQLALGNRSRFGRSSEKLDDPAQISFMEVDGNIVFFNEAEAVCDLEADEPETLETMPHRKKTKGRKEADLSGLDVEIISHYLSETQLTAEFGVNGWKQLPDLISKHYRFVPALVKVEEHHIGVYASKKDEHMVKAPHPRSLLHGSLVSASLAAAIMNGKYVNAVPLYRLEQEFTRYGLNIPRKNMANWMIRLGEDYLGLLYDYLHEKLYQYHVIQADETPVLVSKDGRHAGSKSWMWVYRTGFMYPDRPIILYDYERTRNSSHPYKFLQDYTGICVTDGYEVYHCVEKKLETLTIAGCWVHGRRRFEQAMQLLPKDIQKETDAYLILKQIQAIYREENRLKGFTGTDRLKQRQTVIQPMVDALFVYLKKNQNKVGNSTQLKKAYSYMLKQEQYLRVFLTDGDVPMDNNASERAIRGFTIGRKNWQMIDTINGAKASAIIYSIAETAKANNLKPYDYFEYLLTELPRHTEDTDRAFLEDLLPWSENLPKHIRKT